jgi:hypothetical protein
MIKRLLKRPEKLAPELIDNDCPARPQSEPKRCCTSEVIRMQLHKSVKTGPGNYATREEVFAQRGTSFSLLLEILNRKSPPRKR